MNYLDLCQRVRQESGVSGDGPTSVVNQNGILARVVDWVGKAAIDVQLAQPQWSFLWATASGSLTASTGVYLKGDLGVSDLKQIMTFDVNNVPVEVRDWHWWVANIRRNNKTDEVGTPRVAVMSPDEKIHIWPVPPEALPTEIDYYKKPIPLVNNVDVPVIPENYHQIIVERALMFYADYEEDQYLFSKKQYEYENWLTRLAAEFLPRMNIHA